MPTKIRLKFAKMGRLQFLSHLDLMRSFERGLRRARLPVSLSEGFHPKPKMAFASALAVGVTSEAEYVDIEFSQEVSADAIIKAFAEVLPESIPVLTAIEVPPNSPALMAIVNAAWYRITISNSENLEITSKIEELLQSTELIAERTTKNGVTSIDLRPLLFDLQQGRTKEGLLTLDLWCASGSQGNFRPDEIVKLLNIEDHAVSIHRLGLFVRRANEYITPLDVTKGL